MPLLHFTEYGDPQSAQPPLIMLHGLFGSADNWASMAKALASTRRVICPDLRNHGRSFHAAQHNYAVMAADVIALCDHLDLPKIALLGHSMGGKVTLQVAIDAPERLECAVVVDMAMRAYADLHSALIDAMLAVPMAHCASRSAVDAALQTAIPDRMVRQFLLTNVVQHDGQLHWRLNLPVLRDQYPQLQAAVLGAIAPPCLVIYGEHSDYVTPPDRLQLQQAAPHMQLLGLPTAHWVHAEQPALFVAHVQAFLAAL